MPAAPVRHSPDVGKVATDEGRTIDGLNEAFDTILTTVADHSGHALRSVHAKAHGILEGTLRIDAGLPPELAQGLFAKPGEHKVYMRMSTNAGDILPDAVSLPRGLAIIAEGDRVLARLRFTGRHTGTFQGTPATGNTVDIAVMAYFRVADGRLAEHWALKDNLGMLKRIGTGDRWSGPGLTDDA